MDSDSDSSFCEIVTPPTRKGQQVRETPPTQLRRRIRILQKENEKKHQLGLSLGAAATKAKDDFKAQRDRAEKAEAACEAQKESSRLQVPWFWEEGGAGGAEGGGEIKVVEVKKDTEEWTTVAKTFLKTLGSSVIVDLDDLPHIKRIQNPYLWQSYQAKATAIRERALREGVSERRRTGYERHGLWHGTDHSTIEKVVTQGFNRSFAGKNATAWGKGVYFATTSEYSHRFARVNAHGGTQLMLLCSVLVGEYCRGVCDAKVPDERDATTHLLYDSTTDNMIDNKRQMYVTYNDAQAYAHYQIEYRLKQPSIRLRSYSSGLEYQWLVLARAPWPAPPSTRLRPSVVLRKKEFDIGVVPASSTSLKAAAPANVAPSLAAQKKMAAPWPTNVAASSLAGKKKVAAPWPIIIALGLGVSLFLGFVFSR